MPSLHRVTRTTAYITYKRGREKGRQEGRPEKSQETMENEMQLESRGNVMHFPVSASSQHPTPQPGHPCELQLPWKTVQCMLEFTAD